MSLLLKCSHWANRLGIPLLEQTSTLQSSYSRSTDLVPGMGEKPTTQGCLQPAEREGNWEWTFSSGGERLERKRHLCYRCTQISHQAVTCGPAHGPSPLTGMRTRPDHPGTLKPETQTSVPDPRVILQRQHSACPPSRRGWERAGWQPVGQCPSDRVRERSQRLHFRAGSWSPLAEALTRPVRGEAQEPAFQQRPWLSRLVLTQMVHDTEGCPLGCLAVCTGGFCPVGQLGARGLLGATV